MGKLSWAEQRDKEDGLRGGFSSKLSLSMYDLCYILIPNPGCHTIWSRARQGHQLEAPWVGRSWSLRGRLALALQRQPFNPFPPLAILKKSLGFRLQQTPVRWWMATQFLRRVFKLHNWLPLACQRKGVFF